MSSIVLTKRVSGFFVVGLWLVLLSCGGKVPPEATSATTGTTSSSGMTTGTTWSESDSTGGETDSETTSGTDSEGETEPTEPTELGPRTRFIYDVKIAEDQESVYVVDVVDGVILEPIQIEIPDRPGDTIERYYVSPNGRWLLSQVSIADTFAADVYATDLEHPDLETRRVTTEPMPQPGKIEGVVFSAMSDAVAISAGSLGQGGYSYYLVHLGDEPLLPLGLDPQPQAFAYRGTFDPSGERFAFIRTGNLYISDLATDPTMPVKVGGFQDSVSWAWWLDKERIFRKLGSFEEKIYELAVSLWSSPGESASVVVDDGAVYDTVGVAPDGRGVVEWRDPHSPPLGDLYYFPLGEGSIGVSYKLNTASIDTPQTGHRWSPDSKWFAFVDEPFEGDSKVHIRDMTSAEPGPALTLPWAPGKYSGEIRFSPSGKSLFYGQGIYSDTALFRVDLGQGVPGAAEPVSTEVDGIEKIMLIDGDEALVTHRKKDGNFYWFDLENLPATPVQINADHADDDLGRIRLSPAGRYILYTVNSEDFYDTIYLIDREGAGFGVPQQLPGITRFADPTIVEYP